MNRITAWGLAFFLAADCLADAQAEWLKTGKAGLMDNDAAPAVVKAMLPSFNYNGKAFAAAAWMTGTRELGTSNNAAVYVSEFFSPDKKLKLSVETRVWTDFPVVELRPSLETAGGAPTESIDGFRSLALRALPGGVRCVNVRTVTGSKTTYTDFIRRDVQLIGRHQCDSLVLSTAEGRSAADWLPYFGIDFTENEGLEVAIGWTGNWTSSFRYDGKTFTLESGLSRAHFKMLPGEKFGLPSMLVFTRHAQTRRAGTVAFHRFLIQHKAPRDAQGNLYRPLLALTAGGGNKTDENMLKIIELKKQFPGIGFDTFWVDANWYGPPRDEPQPPNCAEDWWVNTGDWRVNTKTHPTGSLKPASDAARAAGMKFLLWFEAERCSAIAPIVKEHPEYFLRTKNPDPNVNLVNLGDDKARGWLLDAVSGAIRTNGVDIYRQDFNMDPAANWADNDTPDRIGVTEIKYINGLYSYWDALRARFNQMLLENCASGGRRMDYEMQSRAHSYCRDDAQMSPHCEELCQNITLNSTAYIPFTGGETFTVAKHDDYGFVSCVAAGTVFTPTDFGFLFREPFTEADLKWFNDMYRIADRVRPFYMGDFYALTEPAVDSSEIWCAWQCDDPVAKAGFFIAFRRARCGQASLALDLGGIDPAREYELEVYGQPDKVRMKGEALAKYVVTLPQPRSFQLVFYKGL